MGILGSDKLVLLNEDFIDMPFAGSIDETFDKVQTILEENNLSHLNMVVLANISAVIESLASLAHVHENLVFDIAQIYILIKHSKLPFEKLDGYFDELAIKRAKVLLKKFSKKEDYLKYVFESPEWAYIRKIKLADYLFELKLFQSQAEMKNSDLFNEVMMVVEKYESTSQKNLISEIKAIAFNGGI